MNNLAMTLKRMQRLDEAVDLYKRIIADHERDVQERQRQEASQNPTSLASEFDSTRFKRLAMLYNNLAMAQMEMPGQTNNHHAEENFLKSFEAISRAASSTQAEWPNQAGLVRLMAKFAFNASMNHIFHLWGAGSPAPCRLSEQIVQLQEARRIDRARARAAMALCTTLDRDFERLRALSADTLELLRGAEIDTDYGEVMQAVNGLLRLIGPEMVDRSLVLNYLKVTTAAPELYFVPGYNWWIVHTYASRHEHLDDEFLDAALHFVQAKLGARTTEARIARMTGGIGTSAYEKWHALKVLEARLAFVDASRIGVAADHETAAQSEVLVRQIVQLRAALGNEVITHLDQALHPQVTSWRQLREHLKAREGVLMLLTPDTESVLYGLFLTKSGVTFLESRIAGTEDVHQKLVSLVESARASTENASHFDTGLSRELFGTFLGPIQDRLSELDVLYVLQGNKLASFPFDLLLREDRSASSGNRWLIADVAVVELTSLAPIVRRIDKGPHRLTTYIGIGAPKLNTSIACEWRNYDALRALSSTEATPADSLSNRVRNLCSLPGARYELRSMARHFPKAQVFTDEEATEQLVFDLNRRGAFKTSDVIHFATHAVLGGQLGDNPEPALVLVPGATDGDEDNGLLSFSEILGLSLDADMVLLSACETGRLDNVLILENMSAMARAFMIAGARSLAATKWPVSDVVMKELIASWFQMLKQKPELTRARALQEAKLKLIRYRDPLYNSPYSWGSLQLINVVD
jgi:CHAT domain-containing protein